MMINIYKVVILLLFSSVYCLGQTNNTDSSYVLIGSIVDGKTNQALQGANILSSNQLGTKTNYLGEFSIYAKAYDTLKISYIGYKTYTYVTPYLNQDNYLIKFRLYKDSIALQTIDVFPYPTFEEFKKAFIAQDKQDEQIKMKGIKTYVDRDVSYKKPSVLSPASFIYDKLFDKKAKIRRKLKRRREKVRESIMIDE